MLTKEFVKDDAGRLSGIRRARGDWSSGRPAEAPDSESVLLRTARADRHGLPDPEHAVLDDLGVEKDERGNCRSIAGYRTSREGVFTAGDMRRGQSLVVWAIAEGRECAREVDAHLSGRPRCSPRGPSREATSPWPERRGREGLRPLRSRVARRLELSSISAAFLFLAFFSNALR